MKAALLLLLAGLAMLAYSTTLPIYKDEQVFRQRYGEMHAGDSAAFHALRHEMLTPKYKLHDYGLCALLLSVVVALRKPLWRLTKPRTQLPIIGAALLAPVSTTGASVFELLESMTREEAPHWADSVGIPLMGAPPMFIFCLVCSLLHLWLLPRRVDPRDDAGESKPSRGGTLWLMLMVVLAALLTLQALYEGAYAMVIGCLPWLYLYLALIAVRRAPQLPPANVSMAPT